MSTSAQVATAHLSAALILGIYGVEVCPFIDGLGYLGVLPVMLGAAACALGLRFFVVNDTWDHPERVFFLELSGWFFAALLVTGYNVFVHSFPLGSGLKVSVGYLALGLPLSLYAGLLAERDLILSVQASSDRLNPSGPKRSIPTRLNRVVILSQCLLAGVIALLIAKDLRVIETSLHQQQIPPFGLIMLEIGGAFIIVLALNALVTHRYSRNIRLLLDRQVAGLQAVADGHLEMMVPVIANDELATIGDRTNTVIETLRERERIKSIFGKLVSPQVADAVLKTEEGMALGGRDVEAVVLFSDLRNFTAMTENLEPHQVVSFLNEYFSMVVEAIHAEGGVVDKFIGDAVMAVFGLEGERCPPDAPDRAFRAALAMRKGLFEVNARLTARGLPEIANGTGLHLGTMVAGNIGSEDRLEYTVIGDAVNTASRLEGLCRTLGSPLVVSQVFRERLSNDYQEQLRPMGDIAVKGKQAPVSVFGLSTADST